MSSYKPVSVYIVDENDFCHFKVVINCRRSGNRWLLSNELHEVDSLKYPQGGNSKIQHVSFTDVVVDEPHLSFVDETRDNGELSIRKNGKFLTYYSKGDPIRFESDAFLLPDGFYVKSTDVVHSNTTNFALFYIWVTGQDKELSSLISENIVVSDS